MSPSRQVPAAVAPSAAAPPSARPGQPAKRRAIIEAAKRVFLRHGFTDTSVDAIAAEAGVSKQTIYNHFGDKERLFSAVVEAVRLDAAAESDSWFTEEFVESGDLDRDLRSLGRLWVRLMLRPDTAALRRLIIAEQFRHPELSDEWTRGRPEFEMTLSQEIERQTQLGALEVTDPGLAARQFILLVISEAITQSRYGLRELSTDEIDAIVDDGVEMWLRCYRARPAP